MNSLRTFAETAEPSGDILSALGIDWRLLILQIIAFLILVVLLGKFVYPWLMKSVDERHKHIEEAAEAAKRAEKAASQSQADTAELLETARKEAGEIVSTAKLEATRLVSDSEAKAKSSAEKITKAAREELAKDIAKAKHELHDETLELIALATEKVVRGTHGAKQDNELIAQSLKDVEKAAQEAGR